MKKIDWIATAWIDPDRRFSITRISPEREDVMLRDFGKPVLAFSNVDAAMKHAEHLQSKGTR